VRIARFVHPGNANGAGLVWGTVEGPEGADRNALTVAEIKEHPFGPIEFTGNRWALPDVRLVAPILPSKVVAIGKNYADHVKEMGGDAPPTTPVIFLKPSTSVIGDGDPIRIPPGSTNVHHEAELAIVISRPSRDVPRERAMDHVLGYTCANDVTERDQQSSDGQWARAKGYDSFCPIGPWIETNLDPSGLGVRALVNGQVKQDGNTRDLVHDIPALIAFMSSVMTLLPGDIILTGTPAGVGPIKDGDTVSVEIEGIGTLTNPVLGK
jgi:2-keto-4-pentenoate hydratase/2-oxohepta-3-ene-1,7-dioic acid hydratase in catechol pathway